MPRTPKHYDPDYTDDPHEAATKRYLKSDKGKKAVRKYWKSDKGRAVQKRDYAERRKPQNDLIKAFQAWCLKHPGGTAEEFLKEVQGDGAQ